MRVFGAGESELLKLIKICIFRGGLGDLLAKIWARNSAIIQL